jgi:hypothetical protein
LDAAQRAARDARDYARKLAQRAGYVEKAAEDAAKALVGVAKGPKGVEARDAIQRARREAKAAKALAAITRESAERAARIVERAEREAIRRASVPVPTLPTDTQRERALAHELELAKRRLAELEEDRETREAEELEGASVERSESIKRELERELAAEEWVQSAIEYDPKLLGNPGIVVEDKEGLPDLIREQAGNEFYRVIALISAMDPREIYTMFMSPDKYGIAA